MPSSSSTSSRGPDPLRVALRRHPGPVLERELDEFRPDLILSDYTLPRFDGMAALSLARERAPAVPFLIVTGSVNEETAVGCMKAGATDYLLKNNLARIGPAIEAALARVQSRAEKARAEEALRRSEANLRAIFNTSLQAFVLLDRDGTIQAMNPTAAGWATRILGREVGRRRPDPRLHSRRPPTAFGRPSAARPEASSAASAAPTASSAGTRPPMPRSWTSAARSSASASTRAT